MEKRIAVLYFLAVSLNAIYRFIQWDKSKGVSLSTGINTLSLYLYV
jgi:hypothetical protein